MKRLLIFAVLLVLCAGCQPRTSEDHCEIFDAEHVTISQKVSLSETDSLFVCFMGNALQAGLLSPQLRDELMEITGTYMIYKLEAEKSCKDSSFLY